MARGAGSLIVGLGVGFTHLCGSLNRALFGSLVRYGPRLYPGLTGLGDWPGLLQPGSFYPTGRPARPAGRSA